MSTPCPKCGGQTKILNPAYRVCTSILCDSPPFAVEDLEALFSDDQPTLRRLPPDTKRDLFGVMA